MTSFIFQIWAAAKAGDVKLEKLILNIILWSKKKKREGLGLDGVFLKNLCEYEIWFNILLSRISYAKDVDYIGRESYFCFCQVNSVEGYGLNWSPSVMYTPQDREAWGT